MKPPKSLNPTDHLQPDLSQILETIVAPVQANILTLTSFPDLNTVPREPVWDLIRLCSAIPNMEAKVMASIMAGVVTDKRPIFILGRSSFNRMVQDSPYFARKQFNGDEIKQIKGRLINGSAFLRELYPPSQRNQGKSNKGGIYTIASTAFTSLLNWWPNEEQLLEMAAKIPHEEPNNTPLGRNPTTKYKYEYKIDSNAEGNCNINNKFKIHQVVCITDEIPDLNKGQIYKVRAILHDGQFISVDEIEGMFLSQYFEVVGAANG